MFESKVEHKIGRNGFYYVYVAIEVFRTLLGLAFFTFAGFAVILFCPVILAFSLMPRERIMEYPLIGVLGPLTLIALSCFAVFYMLLGVEKLLFSKTTIREFKNRMMTICPAQFEPKKEDHCPNPDQKTYNFPTFDRKKLYDEMKTRLKNVSSCRAQVQVIHKYLEEQGAFKDLAATDSDCRLPEITSQGFPKGILPNRTRAVMQEALWHLNRGSEDQYWHEVEDMILNPFPDFPVTPVELQVFHVLFEMGHRATWRKE